MGAPARFEVSGSSGKVNAHLLNLFPTPEPLREKEPEMSETISTELLLPIAAELFREITPEKSSPTVSDAAVADLIDQRTTDFANFFHQLKAKLEHGETSLSR